MQIILDLIPILLAVVALIKMSTAFEHMRRMRDRAILLFGCISASLLIVAQLSWWSTFVLKQELFDDWYVNYIWTAFNSLTMLTFILFAAPRKHDTDNS